MKKVTRENVADFADFCAEHYGIRIAHYGSKEHRAVRRVARWIAGIDVDRWLSRWSITLPGIVWLSFQPGGVHPSPMTQALTIVHELEHVRQWRKLRGKFLFRYLFSRRRRAEMERDALAAEMAWGGATGLVKSWNTTAMANMLKSYRVDSKRIKEVAEYLDKIANSGLTFVHTPASSWWCDE